MINSHIKCCQLLKIIDPAHVQMHFSVSLWCDIIACSVNTLLMHQLRQLASERKPMYQLVFMKKIFSYLK